MADTGRPSKYDPAFCNAVEQFMGDGYSLTAFAGSIGVARSTINEWIGAHPEFSEAVSRAKSKRLLKWETDAMRVAQKGGGPGTATIIVFGLKNMGDDEWSDTQRHELSGRNGAPIETKPNLSLLSIDELKALEAIRAKLAAPE